LLAARRRAPDDGGLLPGREIHRDRPGARTLVSHRLRLVGRPDRVDRARGGLVPVEVKSRARGAGGPHPGERARLLACCALVEEVFREPLPHGELRFRDRAVTVPFGREERREIEALLARMDRPGAGRRNHAQAARCRGCGFRDRCPERLA